MSHLMDSGRHTTSPESQVPSNSLRRRSLKSHLGIVHRPHSTSPSHFPLDSFREIYPAKWTRAPSQLLRQMISFNHAGLRRTTLEKDLVMEEIGTRGVISYSYPTVLNHTSQVDFLFFSSLFISGLLGYHPGTQPETR